MSTSVTERPSKAASKLSEGDWLAPSQAEPEPVQLLSDAILWDSPSDGPRATLVYRLKLGAVNQWTLNPDAPVFLLTEEEIEALRLERQRSQLVRDLNAFSHLVNNQEIPTPGRVHISLKASGRAEVESIGKALDVEPTTAWNGGLQLTWPKGRLSYQDGLYVSWHTDEKPVEPDPKPALALDPERGHVPAVEDLGEGFGRSQTADADETPPPVELKPWESDAPLADRIAESMEPGAVSLIRCGCGPTHATGCKHASDL